MRRRHVQVWAVAVTALAAAACGVWVSCRWTDLVRVPLAWSKLRRLQEDLDRREASSERDGDEKGLRAALDAAAFDLVRLQVPDFAGGERFELERIPTDDGSRVFLLCYSNTKTERLPHPDAGGFLPERFSAHHRFLRGNGRLFVPESPFFLGHDRGYHVVIQDGGTWKPGVYWPHNEGGWMGTDYPPRLYTWDRKGFVPHGFVDETPHAAPGVNWRWKDPIPFDPERARGLLRSGLSGDILRGLEQESKSVEWADELARPFVGHADADVRTRALSLLRPGRANLATFEAALADPSPRVRLTALRGYSRSTCSGWRDRLSRAAADPDPWVSEEALRALTTSFDRATSCHAVERLVTRGCRLSMSSDLATVRACSSPALGQALRREFAAASKDSDVWGDLLGLLLALEDEETDRFLLGPGTVAREALLRGDRMPSDCASILCSRRTSSSLLADQYRAILQDPAAGDARLVAAAALDAWGEPGIAPVLAGVLANLECWEDDFEWGWGLLRRLARDRQVAAALVKRLLSADDPEASWVFNVLLLHAEPLAPGTTLPFLRGLLDAAEPEPWETLMARFVLARWKIPLAKEELEAVLWLPAVREASVAEFDEFPELLDDVVVRGTVLGRLERVRTDGADHEGSSLFEELLRTLAEQHARTPIPGAIPVLDRIADSDLWFAPRAALRLAAWGAPGGRERLARLVEEGCWAYGLPPAERAEIPEDLRARLAARE